MSLYGGDPTNTASGYGGNVNPIMMLLNLFGGGGGGGGEIPGQPATNNDGDLMAWLHHMFGGGAAPAAMPNVAPETPFQLPGGPMTGRNPLTTAPGTGMRGAPMMPPMLFNGGGGGGGGEIPGQAPSSYPELVAMLQQQMGQQGATSWGRPRRGVGGLLNPGLPRDPGGLFNGPGIQPPVFNPVMPNGPRVSV